jgi:hypothetical protein
VPPLHRDHVVHGPFVLVARKLTFQCGGGLLAYDARQAMDAGRDFTVTLTPPEGVKEVTGKVLSVDLLKDAKPLRYEIVMRISS